MAHLRTHSHRRSLGRLISSVVAPSALISVLVMLLLGPGSASAQSATVSIASLNCDGSPEVVQLTNSGTESIALEGWALVSDPASETFDLGVIGTLSAGSSVFINSGPGASGVFVWSTSEVFRNGDPTDYARLVDAEGVTVATVNCTAATPAANVMPSGGGPPSNSSALTIGAIAAAAGGALLALTMLTGLLWMGVGVVTGRSRRASSHQEDEIVPAEAEAPAEAPIVADVQSQAPAEPEAVEQAPARQAPQPEPNLWPYLFVVLGAIVAALVLVLALSSASRKK